MPKAVEQFRVFVSSPGDIREDRAIARRAIQSASQILKQKGISLEPWLWEEEAHSEFGISAQSSIEDQLGDYDIYIGLMGSRFGSSTEGYGSGTEKEFSHALNAKKREIYDEYLFYSRTLL